MDYPLGLALLLAGGGMVAVTLAWGAWRLRRRRAVLRAPVLVGAAMTRYGITPADAAAAGLEGEMFSARERCAHCPSEEICRQRLIAAVAGPFPSDCPNLAFFSSIQSFKEAADTPTQR